MYKINKRKMFFDITDNFTIVINSETGIYYGINTFGTAVFENLIKCAAVADILAELQKISDVPSDMEQRLDEFITKLKSLEIIMDAPTVETAITIKPEQAATDNFVLQVEEYADMQEFLLADPIHEVDAEQGWQPVLKD